MSDVTYKDQGRLPAGFQGLPFGGRGDPDAGLPSATDDDLPPGLKSGVTEAAADLKREEIKRGEAINKERLNLLDLDQQRIARQYDATAIQPGEFPKWDADAQSQKYQTDPIQAFGSLGSVFGMIASAFTHAPMENALNASAAAMNAIRAGDEEKYNRAHTAWKENTDLAFKRHTIERERYQDAISLFNTNVAAGDAKWRMNAAMSNDQQTLNLLDHGLYKEAIELQNQRNKAMINAMHVSRELEGDKIRQALFDQDSKPISEAIKAGTISSVEGLRSLLEMHNIYFGTGVKSGDERSQRQAQFMLETLRRTGHPPTSDEMIANDKAITEALTRPLLGGTGGGGNVNLTDERQRAAAVQRIMEEKRQNGELEGKSQEQIARIREDVSRQLKTEGAAITGKTKDDLASQIERFQLSEQTIDKVESLLKKHNALAGLGGRITRPAEVVGNVFGSNATDRAQFRSYISELREWAPRLLNESKSRPLAAEERNISAIVRGLDAGDTTANTARNLLELKKLFGAMRDQATRRIEGTFDPRDAGAPQAPHIPVPAGGTGDEELPAWKRLGIPDKKSEVQPQNGQSMLSKVASFFNPMGTAQAEELPPQLPTHQQGLGPGQLVAPGIHAALTERPPPPVVPPQGYEGKYGGGPGSFDPRVGPALKDVRDLIMMAVPELGALGRAAGEAGGRIAGAFASPAGATERVAAAPAQAARPPAAQPGPEPTAATPQPQSIRPDFTPQDVTRLKELQTDITSLSQQRAKATKDLGPRGAAVQAQAYDQQIQAKQEEAERIRKNVAEQQRKFDDAGQPMAVRDPEEMLKFREAGLGAALATGSLKGATGSGIKRFLKTLGYGGVEGAAGVMTPTLLDLAAAPGTPAHETAVRNLDPHDPAFWDYMRHVVGPEAVGGMGYATAGYGGGQAIREGGKQVGRIAGSLYDTFSRKAPTITETVARAERSSWPTDAREIAQLKKSAYKDSAGRWRAADGRFLPRNLQP